jgi:hypothetical protein
MKRLSRSTLILLAVIALLASAMGYVLLEKHISAPGYIRASFNMKIFDVDHLTELATIDLGGLTKRTADEVKKCFPWGVDMYDPSSWSETETYYFLDNTNEMDFYLGFTVENAPPNMLFTFGCVRADNTLGGFWKGVVDTNAPSTVVYPIVINGKLNATGLTEKFVYWWIGVDPLPEAIGETYFTATLVFKALDSLSG